MYVLNFSLPDYGQALLRKDAFCTIRLGDRSDTYHESGVVWVTNGAKRVRKKYLYPAFIDKVLIKPVPNITSKDLGGDPLGFKSQDELVQLLETINKRPIQPTDIVTVIYFSRIM